MLFVIFINHMMNAKMFKMQLSVLIHYFNFINLNCYFFMLNYWLLKIFLMIVVNEEEAEIRLNIIILFLFIV